MSAEPEDLPEGVKDIREVGLFNKYRVFKEVRQGTHINLAPVEDRVFVLKPRTDPIGRKALLVYAVLAEEEGHFQLAQDIRAWIRGLRIEEEVQAVKDEAIQRFDLTEPQPKEN